LDSALALQWCFLHGTPRSGPIAAAGQYSGDGEHGGAAGAWGSDSGRGPRDGGATFPGHDLGSAASSSRATPASSGHGSGDLGAVQVSGLDSAPAQGHDGGGPSCARSEGFDCASSDGVKFGGFESGGGGGGEHPHLSAPIGSHEPGASSKPLQAGSGLNGGSSELIFSEGPARSNGASISPPVTPPLGKRCSRGRQLRCVRPRGRMLVSSSSPVASCGGGRQVTVQNSPPMDVDSHFPSSPYGKRSLLVGSVEVLLVPPDPGPRVPPDTPLLFWLRKDLAN
jgi:hypothetical protein